MKTKLIALLSGNWNEFLNEFEATTESIANKKKSPHFVLAKEWESSLSTIEGIEVALFQPGLVGITDEFPNHFRRFIQVGKTADEKIQNLFELGFEKGYDSVIFVEEFLASHSTKKIKAALNGLDQVDMVFGPNEDGSLYLWGMNKKDFWNWNYFEYLTKESIVEMLSICNENNLTYKVLSSINRNETEAEFRNILAKQ